MPNGIEIFFQLLFLICVFCGVLALAYFVTKKMAQVRQGTLTQKNLKIVEGLTLGQGQALFIVQVGREYHLIGMTKEHIEYCMKLDESQLHFENVQDKPFENYLTKWAKGKQEKEDDQTKQD